MVENARTEMQDRSPLEYLSCALRERQPAAALGQMRETPRSTGSLVWSFSRGL